ncbi:hypothetical protein H310_04325 [Aphanomyces invadans]|uniref:Uncharacterized protein n=1 Tax=Aphanomyces invadans TaxID=157072 RepID=A0A024UCJ9_9STRA|nr:hypothetical protein H310_04325 [Aphanomyces invadans]ETW03905.1 hypothetical protein H310_04325 [Aphanomyces invadans]|eukprot:XP_008866861.1 hypothetical protein H310_04325 [Aphanomyces invadans]
MPHAPPSPPPLAGSAVPSSPSSAVVPPDLRCRYAYKECKFPRSQRKNGKLHSLCEAHRRKANSVQKLYAMKRRNTHVLNSTRPRPPATTRPTMTMSLPSTLVHVKRDAAHHPYRPTYYHPCPHYDRLEDDTYLRLMEIKRRIHDAWERRTSPHPVCDYHSSTPTSTFSYEPPSLYAAQY